MVPSSRDLSGSEASPSSPPPVASTASSKPSLSQRAISAEQAISSKPSSPKIGPKSGVRLSNTLMYGVAYCIVAGQRLLQSMVSRIFQRLRRAVLTLPTWGGWLDTAAIALLYGCIVLVVGFTAGLLSLPLPEELSREALSPRFWLDQMLPENLVTFAGVVFLVPVLVEELIFRALLLPRREERLKRKWAWSALALGLFVAWYPLLAHFGTPFLAPELVALLNHRGFLALALLLGVGSTWLYRRTGSLWSPVVFHWLAVVAWKIFGGVVPSFF